MYHYKKHKKVRFARVGGLSSVKQKGYSPEMKSYHSPPARKGIYAFIYPYMDWFLLSGECSSIGEKHAKYEYVKDNKGNIVEFPLDEWKEEQDKAWKESDKLSTKKFSNKWQWEDYWNPPMENKEFNNYRFYCADTDKEKGVVRFIKRKNMKVFDYTGELWCHLGSYVKRQSDILQRKGSWVLVEYDVFVESLNRCFHNMGKQLLNADEFGFKPEDDFSIVRHFGKEHLEVFIEKV